MNDLTRLLIIDDDENLGTQMKWALSDDYQVFLAEDCQGALKGVRQHRPALATLDLGLPPSAGDVREGMKALDGMLRLDPALKIVVITGQDEKKHGLEAIQQGACDFFTKPVDIEELKVILKRALYLQKLEKQNQQLREDLQDSFEGMLGASPPMQKVFGDIRKVAGSDAPVLICGESGTGKELAAQAIHRSSPRAKAPFVPINCGAIPENLLESELFGHEKGSFTGAHTQRAGRIEGAQGGTLFLDEIGELSLALQVKLLRFLQEGKIERVGGRREIPVDARIIAATNADLEKAMAEGRFREDLYFRLAVVRIAMPRLQEREGDIPVLARYFLKKYAAEASRKITGLSAKALQALESRKWAGNVRELENLIRRAAVMAESAHITPADLGLDSDFPKYHGMGLREAREAAEREVIERSLSRNQGNLSRAAAELQISRPTLYELIEKLGISR